MKDRIVCITGGYGRLGLEFARAFKKAGATTILAGRNAAKLESAAQNTKSDFVVADVTNPGQVSALATHVSERYGKLDVLINNAGIMKLGSVVEMGEEAFLEVLMTNVYGSFLCTRRLLPLIKKGEDPIIINISSTSGHRADAGTSAYNASKFGLIGFTESLRKELRKEDIRVTSISPSSIHYGDDAPNGKGARLNGADIAEYAVFVASQPGRTLCRDIELWATNP